MEDPLNQEMVWPTHLMFNSCVMCTTLRSKAETEQMSVIGAVSDKEWTVWHVLKTGLGIVPIHGSPVPSILQQNNNKHHYIRYMYMYTTLGIPFVTVKVVEAQKD